MSNKKSILRVVNVDHGDCLVLNPGSKCKYHGNNIVIDVGSGKRNIFQNIDGSMQNILVLTHAHKDHIGGLSWIVSGKPKVDEIWLPMYYDEILLITEFVLNLKGVHKISLNAGPIIEAKNCLSTARLLNSLSEAMGCSVKGKFDRLELCEHLSVLNPPLSIESVFRCESEELDVFIDSIRRNDFSEFRDWIDSDLFSRYRNTIFAEGWYYDVPDLAGIYEEHDLEHRMRFFYAFFYGYRETINRFVENPSSSAFSRILSAVKRTSNDCSLILGYRYLDMSALFAGDAGKGVFKRLNNDGRLQNVSILKIPHHGSKNNMNKSLMKKLAPKVAIICHNNGRFGRQRDPHPNIEIVEMLDDLRIRALYTNPVIKNGIEIKPQALGSYMNGQLEFV